MNFLIIALAALVPLVVGTVWYNPKVLGTAWMKASDMSPEKMKGANMFLILGLSLLFSFMMAVLLSPMVIHQVALDSIVMGDPDLKDPNSALSLMLKDFMAKYGQNFRTFKHGAFHGVLAGIFFVLPVIGTHALYERKSFQYIAINVGYWVVNLGLMGGIICAFA